VCCDIGISTVEHCQELIQPVPPSFNSDEPTTAVKMHFFYCEFVNDTIDTYFSVMYCQKWLLLLFNFSVSGCTDYYAETEQEAFQMGRASVAAFNFDPVVANPSVIEPVYNAEELLGIIPADNSGHLDMYQVVIVVVSNGSAW